MKNAHGPIRLLVEVLAIAAVAQVCVLWMLPMLGPGDSPAGRLALGAALLVLLSGPTVYWRCMAMPTSRTQTSSAAAKGAPRGSTVNTAIAMTAAAQALGLALTAASAVWQQRSISDAAKERFDRGAERIETEVRRHFALPLYGLNGLRAMFAANGRISRAEFRAWVQSRDLRTEFPGVRGLGFIERVERNDVPAFVAARQIDGSRDYTVDTAGNAPDLYLVKYIEPLSADNRAALGKDVGRDAVRREAVERAAIGGRPTLSGRITLMQDGKLGPGLLYLVPLYTGGVDGDLFTSPEERRANLVGLMYAPIIAADVMKGVVDVAEGNLSIELFEGDGAPTSHRLYASAREAPVTVDTRVAPAAEDPRFTSTRTFEVGGRRLALRAASSPAFEASIDRSSVTAIVLFGSLASFLMALAVWLLAVGRVRAQRRAQRMTADLARLAHVVQRTSNSVAITDAQMRISWVNEGFTRITGYTLAEAAGRTPGELLGSGGTDPATLKTLHDGLAAGSTCRVEILNRARDGREYWMDTEVQPSHDANGELTGFMEVGSDITVLKQTQLQLEAAIRDSDALLRTVHRHAIVSVADRDGIITEVNDAFCRISGYDRKELLGHNHRIIESGVQHSDYWAEMWRTIAGGSPWRGQICNRARDGSVYWVDSMIAPFAGPDGTIEKYVSIGTDISATKVAQQRLAQMADRLALAIEGGSDGLWDWMDVTANEQWWSPTFHAMLGHPADGPAPGFKTLCARVHPDQQAAFRQTVDEALRGDGGLDTEVLLRGKAGEFRWFRSRAKVYRDEAGRAVRMAGSLQDIHDRKTAERELGRERARLRQILEGTNVGTWEFNVETGQAHFNERWAEIGGHTLAELSPATMQTWTENTHPDDRSRSAVRLQQHFDGELAYFECETRTLHRDGHWVWVLDRGKLFSRSDAGRPRWMAGTRMDISQRKHAEQALRDSEAFLDRAGHIAGVGGWRVILKSKAVIWTEQTCRIHEMPIGHQPSPKEALGFYPPAAQSVLLSALDEGMKRGKPWDLELPFITSTGRHIWVRTVGEVEFEDGVPVRLVGALQDVTQRRALAEELRSRSELLAGVLQNLPCGLSVFDGALKLVTHNTQFRLLMNLPDTLFDDPDVRFDQFVRMSARRGEYGPGNVDEIVDGVVELARRPVVQFFERQHAQGIPLEIRRAPMPGGGFVTTYTDISMRKQAEILLKEALSRAEQASVTKSQFLANMSHEIRTPMNAILGMLSLLQKTDLSARQMDYAAKTEGAARSLLGLLNDILDFSKAEAGKMTLDPRPFPVDRLLGDLSVILSSNVGAKTIDVLFDVDPAVPPSLLGDDMRLQQVLINLGGNAIKFTTEGEVVLGLHVRDRTDDTVLLEFSVRDTGIGIAPEHQAHIFTGFSQAEASTTRRFGGTGLGLAICQRLVAMMGGELCLRSVPGQGSTFSFQLRLPIAHNAADPVPFVSAGPLRTLIVDDNDTAREVFVGMALSLGWQAEAAPGGSEAVALACARAAAGEPFEAVFLDWKMPGLDGWGTCQQILQATRAANLPAPLLVMITGHGRETLARRSAEEQALLSGFLVKPVTAAMMRDVVSAARSTDPQPAKPSSTGPSRRLAGMRLLVVEDNPNNQQVAQELLADEGALVTLASNGQLGVDAVAMADPAFDAVLMDLQMPVMDGYAATAQIRQRLGMAVLPVIAMTANAMSSDREACLAAGMNDHVGKPFDIADLVAVLLRNTGRTSCGVPNASPIGQADASSFGDADASPFADADARPFGKAGALVEAAGAAVALVHSAPACADTTLHDLLADAQRRDIGLAGALRRMGGNRRVYQRSLDTFRHDLQALSEQLSSHLVNGQLQEAGRLMHTLKGIAATLGIRRLAALAAEVERALTLPEAHPAHTAWAQRMEAMVESTQHDLAHLSEALQQHMCHDAIPARPAVGADVASADARCAMIQALDELGNLLGGADMRAVEVFEQLQQLPAPDGSSAALQALDQAMASLDFDLALLACRSLRMALQP